MFREYREGKYASGLTMESLLWEMLGTAARLQHVHRHTEPVWWTRVIEILHASFRENVRMTELASEAGVHPVYLSRMFRRIEGKTAGTYVQQLRVQHACRGLRERESVKR